MGHKHAALMAQYAEDAQQCDYPWVRWQNRHFTQTTWDTCNTHPVWHEAREYRRKPKTVVINGVELEDDRFTTHPDDRVICYTESVTTPGFYCSAYWSGDVYDKTAIDNGVLHKTKEGAIAFCKARLEIKD